MNFLKHIFESETTKSGIIFIVEDNTAYAKTLEAFLKKSVPKIKEVRLFPVGETCLPELYQLPDLIIMDHFLDSKYFDADTGLENVKKIREHYPEMNIVILSSQEEVSVVIEAMEKYNCSYIKKDSAAFEKIKKLVNELYGS